MEPSIAHDFRPFFLVHKDGHIERLLGGPYVPPSDEPLMPVRSKDVTISTEVSARLYLPNTNTGSKRPVLVYVHGGALCFESAFSAIFHNYLNSLVAAANVIAVSVEYRLAPEHHIPACYDDAWTALQWVALHRSGKGPDSWLNESADLGRIFLAGDSAGGNICHDLAIRTVPIGLGPDIIIAGMVLINPYFCPTSHKLWEFLCNNSGQLYDARHNPVAYPELLKLGCKRVLICVAELDMLKEKGIEYYKALEESEWDGVAEIDETDGEGHTFHLFKPECDKARTLMSRIVSFINKI